MNTLSLSLLKKESTMFRKKVIKKITPALERQLDELGEHTLNQFDYISAVRILKSMGYTYDGGKPYTDKDVRIMAKNAMNTAINRIVRGNKTEDFFEHMNTFFIVNVRFWNEEIFKDETGVGIYIGMIFSPVMSCSTKYEMEQQKIERERESLKYELRR